MLCQFTVKNYKSIKDYLTLDMQASSISELNEKIIEDEDGESFLPLAVIYGPNGSGKSTVLKALASLISKVMGPICTLCSNEKCDMKNIKAQIIPFKFSKQSLNDPTEFELFFRTKKAEYKYNLKVNSNNDIVIYESLIKKNLNGKKNLNVFVRDINSKPNSKIFGTLNKVDASEITESITLLSYLAITYRKNDIIDDIISWFEDGINYFNYGNPYTEMRGSISTEEQIKKLVVKMIKEMDIDIDDYRVDDTSEDRKVEIYTKHIINGSSEELKLYEESSGTLKLFGLLPKIALSLKKGVTLIIDELDAKLHPKLLKYIIELYRNKESNSKGAQLIFTSHDLSTMNDKLFRRDEIWFVAKDSEQASKIYSLVEFKDEEGKSVRKDAKYNKQYLEGRYGADPYLRKIINWEELK